ncbi:MAG: RimK/LysX family protein [Pseudomonadales bacterium]
MSKLYFYSFTKTAYLIGLSLLFSGCASQYRIDQEAQRNQLQQEQQALEQLKAALAEERRELDLKLAQLDEENEQIAIEREQLEQSQRKLEILKTPLHPHTNSKPVAPLKNTKQARLPVPKKSLAPEYNQISHTVIGQLEKVYLEPPSLTFTARVDTGAESSSINTLDITKFERDGKPYVRFHISHPRTGEPVELVRRIRKHKRIKEPNDESQKRPLVRMRVVMGGIDQRIDFSLVDHVNSEYSVIIGRNFLSDFAIVDVSKQFLTNPEINQ